jgi:hypothetical protein
MSHLFHRAEYAESIGRFKRFPEGGPLLPRCYGTLKILLSERGTGLISMLPVKPFGTYLVDETWEMPIQQATGILGSPAIPVLPADIEFEGQTPYVQFPRHIGFQA